MTVLVLTNCPKGLRGLLTRWLLEISSGVFVGRPSRRVRDLLWEEVRQYAGQGRALLVYANDSEQGFGFKTFEHHWEPVEHEGLTLMNRPSEASSSPSVTPPKKGWSKASKRRRFGR
ncbi:MULTISPECIES: type I-E CRISPR-associated endoribonuclease Cas2e [Nocardiopsis]|uniref:Type I-E CRISPR-associated endoribonuclease Cas2e n=1 Tax=Nocardiopsis lambiniae TaxID=3075539 RepID=A0ABU2MB48_9ACTN|nr:MULTISPECIES: type I-E CRISPR-associated endoribonuclease Cas2e [unclassified Nocardiopsis]MDE3720450.1 type I-E CRISPR-associated endoribonuclease Cas2e [Nocardiopsis sp. N85]MDT0329912.1 type I-E CRISPR-associated endoribonuclease Cas2e [Nocardiopsis sp. DSM 44743]